MSGLNTNISSIIDTSSLKDTFSNVKSPTYAMETGLYLSYKSYASQMNKFINAMVDQTPILTPEGTTIVPNTLAGIQGAQLFSNRIDIVHQALRAASQKGLDAQNSAITSKLS